MIRNMTLSAVAALALAGAASAQDPSFTLGGGYSHVDADVASVHGLNFQGGVEFNRHFGFEIEAIAGVTDDLIDVGGTTVEVELEHLIAGFAVGRAPVTANADIYARLGYATAGVSGSTGAVSVALDDEALAYGVGGRWFLTERDGLRADYTRYDFEGSEADVFGLSYVRRFGG